VVKPVALSIETAVPFGRILNELASNALKHGFPDGRSGDVAVVLEQDSVTGMICLRVRDNGIGLPEGLDWRQSNSLGLRLVQMLTAQLLGTVETGPAPGAEFQIAFPLKGFQA
jgi:two-component sensor histidine kinase